MTDISPLDALGDPTRRLLFERLRRGPASVSELVEAVPVSQPAVSQHLKVLRSARLVQVRRQGQQRIYSLDPHGLSELRAYVESLWTDVLTAFQHAAEETARQRTPVPDDPPAAAPDPNHQSSINNQKSAIKNHQSQQEPP